MRSVFNKIGRRRVENKPNLCSVANGNTIICASTVGAKGEERIKRTQVIEVTPDKKVVSALQDWKNLGPATTVQLLDEPGTPEKPVDLQR